jgi:hypothetical protein
MKADETKKITFGFKNNFFYFDDLKKFHHKKIGKGRMMMKLDETLKNY